MQENSYYAVFPGVKCRYEDFGGIIYRRNTDSLFFLQSRLAIDLVSLAGTGSVNEIAEKIKGKHDRQKAVEKVLKILQQLKEMGIVYELES